MASDPNRQIQPVPEALTPQRQRVQLTPGAFVRRGNDVFRIAQILDFESVIGVDVQTGRSHPLRVAELKPEAGSAPELAACDVDEIQDEDWKTAEKRFADIRPLLEMRSFGRQDVEARAKETGVAVATLYRWIKRYRAFDSVSALIPQKRGWKAGRGRISVQADSVVQEVISNFYLTAQRPTAQKAVIEVRRLCLQRQIDPPSDRAIRSRLTRIPERERLRGRGFREQAKNKFLPVPGRFPNADYPLAVIQIDHTPVDLILVDDEFRKPIGRPWITLAIDVCTRMVVGYFLSFDAPSEASVAMCVAHAMLPKDEWLLLHNVHAEWPVWGRPRTIHVDNGPDFRSNTFRQSCLMHGINLEFRPVKQPRFGGHIERILGTFLREVHALPGTTFSSIKHREGYDAEKHAAMTKSEFEEWLVTLICKVYHQRVHSGIGMSPIRRWEIGIFGNADIQGVGMPPMPSDRHTVLLDFLPAFHRTVQPIGVTIDALTYYAEALRPWIGATEEDNPKAKREFIFRRDPRDISTVWFFDPMAKMYFKVPLADQALPRMSIWEYQQARERLKQQGASSVNEHQILNAITELRQKVDDSKERTKRARRQASRRADHDKAVSPAQPRPGQGPDSSAAPSSAGSPANRSRVDVVGAGLLSDDIDFEGDIA